MRTITRQSTARCNIEMYVSYLLSDPLNTTCTRLAGIMETISHDSSNRFLVRERFTPRDLFEEIKPSIELKGGVLSVDDSTLDKPYSDPKKNALNSSFLVRQTSWCCKRLFFSDLVLYGLQERKSPCELSISRPRRKKKQKMIILLKC